MGAMCALDCADSGWRIVVVETCVVNVLPPADCGCVMLLHAVGNEAVVYPALTRVTSVLCGLDYYSV